MQYHSLIRPILNNSQWNKCLVLNIFFFENEDIQEFQLLLMHAEKGVY